MTAIIYKTGSLIEASEPVIVHGCNARGVMGSGVAKSIRESYPAAYTFYRERFLNHGLSVGETQWVECPFRRYFPERIIVNAITQADFGRDGKQYVSYTAIEEAFTAINLHPVFENVTPAVAMPLIGAGLGGGSWPLIAEIIERVMTKVQPVVYTLDGNIPTK